MTEPSTTNPPQRGRASAAVIVNAAAGSGFTEQWASGLASQFKQYGIEAAVTLAKSGAEIDQATQSAVAAGCVLVVAGGGDGTINAVASHIANTDVMLGVLPLGTLNHFAKDLRIPIELAPAIHTIATGQCISVDAAEVNGRIFINNSSIGLYPQVVRHRQHQQRLGRSKWHAFFWATLSVLKRFPFYQITVVVDGVARQHKTPFVFIGNNNYTMEGLQIGQRDSLQDGQLCFYTARRTGRIGLVWLACSALLHRLQQASNLDVLYATEITINTHKSAIRVSTDGEVNLLKPPLRYQIRPGAVRVIVPAAVSTSTQTNI